MCGGSSSTPRPPPPQPRNPTTRRTTTKRPTTTPAAPPTKPTSTERLRTTPRLLTTTLSPFTPHVDRPGVATTLPYGFASKIQTNSGSNDQLQGSSNGIGYIAIIAGTMCLVIPIVIVAIFIWRKSRENSSSKYKNQPSDFDSGHAIEDNGSMAKDGIPSYGESDGDEDTEKPLYSQVDKEKKKNRQGNVNTDSADHQTRPKHEDDASRQQNGITVESNTAVLIEGAAVSYSTGDSNEQTYWNSGEQPPSENGRHVKTESEYKNVSERKNYENVDSPGMPQEEPTYYNKEGFEPEVPSQQVGGDTYDQLNRLDRTIANETVMGENVYDS